MQVWLDGLAFSVPLRSTLEQATKDDDGVMDFEEFVNLYLMLLADREIQLAGSK